MPGANFSGMRFALELKKKRLPIVSSNIQNRVDMVVSDRKYGKPWGHRFTH
jgi:hypothetical protein